MHLLYCIIEGKKTSQTKEIVIVDDCYSFCKHPSKNNIQLTSKVSVNN